jgi:AcrR family transcriptional regulator/DNA-binding MarR family transcriptional regulator
MGTRGRAPSEGAAPDALTGAESGLPRPGTTHGGGYLKNTQRASGLDQPIGHKQVSDIQRARILAAMVEVTAERGAGNVTVAHVVARSGVSRRTFYEHFEDREDCLLAAFDDAIERIVARVVPAFDWEGRWQAKVRAALTALLELLEEERAMGRLVMVETLGAGPKALERRRRVLAEIIAAVDEGRKELKRGDGPPPLTAEGVVGAVLSVIHGRTLEQGPEPLVDLVNPLMSMVVLPYLGPVAARKELAAPTPAHNGTGRASAGNLLKGLNMRLTYRTVRVLLAIGELGERGSYPSNRRVGDAAGISDQGQISKLLARLEHLGLIDNAGFGQAKGESNSWHLTPRGQEIEQAIREQTERR